MLRCGLDDVVIIGDTRTFDDFNWWCLFWWK